MEALNNEIRIFKKFRHKRIVSYYGNEQKDDQLHLFMEFMAGVRAYIACGCGVFIHRIKMVISDRQNYFSQCCVCLFVL